MDGQTEGKAKQDHEIAAEELAAWYAESGIDCEISEPRAGVDRDKGAEPWPHVAFTLIFKRGAVSFSADWRQGVGVGIDWKAARLWRTSDFASEPIRRWSEREGQIAGSLSRRGRGGKPEEVASAAAKVAARQNVKPNPAEVLASLARDGAALLQTFEAWADDYGYDQDSRKAEEVYRACCDAGRKVRSMLSAADIDRLENWAARL